MDVCRLVEHEGDFGANFRLLLASQSSGVGGDIILQSNWLIQLIFFFFFCVPQLYLSGSPLLGEIFAYVTVF